MENTQIQRMNAKHAIQDVPRALVLPPPVAPRAILVAHLMVHPARSHVLLASTSVIPPLASLVAQTVSAVMAPQPTVRLAIRLQPSLFLTAMLA